MISELKAAITSKLLEVFPTGYTVYEEDLPETIVKPAFLIQITNQSYDKQTSSRYVSDISFDLSYFSDKAGLRADCIQVQEKLLRAFDAVDTFRVIKRNAKITEQILHFTFDIRYSEILQEDQSLMQQQQINIQF